eukprot:Rmarinus@m.9214
MATAIDFAELMRRERANAKAKCSSFSIPDARVSIDSSLPRDSDGDLEVVPAVTFTPLSLPPRKMDALGSYRVGESCGLHTLCYVPDFVSSREQAQLLNLIYTELHEWEVLKGRRLQQWGGTPDPSCGMVAQPVPPCFQAVCDVLVAAGVFPPEYAPNHVLLNEYSLGDGIMPHQDGPLYYPVVAIVTLQSPCALDFWRTLQDSYVPSDSSRPVTLPLASVYTRPCSLVVFSEAAYEERWHGIQFVKEDCVHENVVNCKEAQIQHGATLARSEMPRVSLTIRHVLKIRHGQELVTAERAAESKMRSTRFLASITTK